MTKNYSKFGFKIPVYLQIQEPSEFQATQIESQSRHDLIKLLKTKEEKNLESSQI